MSPGLFVNNPHRTAHAGIHAVRSTNVCSYDPYSTDPRHVGVVRHQWVVAHRIPMRHPSSASMNSDSRMNLEQHHNKPTTFMSIIATSNHHSSNGNNNKEITTNSNDDNSSSNDSNCSTNSSNITHRTTDNPPSSSAAAPRMHYDRKRIVVIRTGWCGAACLQSSPAHSVERAGGWMHGLNESPHFAAQ